MTEFKRGRTSKSKMVFNDRRLKVRDLDLVDRILIENLDTRKLTGATCAHNRIKTAS